MGKLTDEFNIDASRAVRVVFTLNREQAEKLAEVLETCVDDDVVRNDWDEPESADLVQDLAAHTRDVLNGPAVPVLFPLCMHGLAADGQACGKFGCTEPQRYADRDGQTWTMYSDGLLHWRNGDNESWGTHEKVSTAHGPLRPLTHDTCTPRTCTTVAKEA